MRKSTKHSSRLCRRLLLTATASFAMLFHASAEHHDPGVTIPSAKAAGILLPSFSFEEPNAWVPANLAPSRAEAITCKPEVTIAKDEQLRFVGAFGKVNGQTMFYGAAPRRGKLSFNMPAGTYLTFAYVSGPNYNYDVLLVKENVVFDADNTLKFNTAEATDSIERVLLMPSGQEMHLPINEGDEANSAIGRIELRLLYEGKVAFSNYTTGLSDFHRYLRTNLRNNPFDITELAFMGTTEGMLNMIYKVDTKKKVVGTTATGWQTASVKFTPTPMNNKYRKIMEDEGKFNYYRSAYVGTASNGVLLSLTGFGMYGDQFDTGKVGFWVPEDYDGPYSWFALPVGEAISGNSSAIVGLPLKRGETEPVQLGVNFGFELMSIGTATDRTFRDYCPPFGGKPSKDVLGNCAPMLMTAPLNNQVQFNYMGRNGEAMNIDSWDLASTLKPDGETKFGNTNSVSVWIGDSLVSDVRKNFPSKIKWDATGKYKIAFSTDNVLIDGKVEGVTSGTLEYDPATYGGVIPSATALQFHKGISGDESVTDRFASLSDKPCASLYAASISQAKGTNFNYLAYAAPESVKVEYAPRGSGQFTEATAVAQDGEFYVTGFGQRYEVDLSGIQTPSSDGWFDMRITVKSVQGSVQTQTISPAFFVSDINGVHSTDADDVDANAPVKYYNLQGIRISAPAKGALTIVRQGSKVSKILVK